MERAAYVSIRSLNQWLLLETAQPLEDGSERIVFLPASVSGMVLSIRVQVTYWEPFANERLGLFLAASG